MIEHIGLSGVTSVRISLARRMVPIVCIQNEYNLTNRGGDALIGELAKQSIAYVPFFPLDGFNPLQSKSLNAVASQIGTSPLLLAQAWLLQWSPNILLILGTSSVEHLRENLAAGEIEIPSDALERLDGITGYNGSGGPTALPTERH